MPQVIGAELRLETVTGVTERRRHDACVGDDDIGGFAFCQQATRRRPARSSIWPGRALDQFELPTVRLCFFLNLFGGPLGFRQAHALLHVQRTVCNGSDCAVSTPAGGDAGDQNSFAAQVDAG